MHTEQSQPMTGTPTEVAVPRNISRTLKSVKDGLGLARNQISMRAARGLGYDTLF